MVNLFIIFALFTLLMLTGHRVSGTSPFCVPDVSLPRSCKGRSVDANRTSVSIENEVTFILYTPKYEPDAKDFIPGDEESYNNSGYNTKQETKIIIHGYYSSAKNFEHMVFAYLTATDYNIILMDWSGLAKWCYCEHVLKTIEKIGKELSKLIEYLVEKGTSLKQIHIIGHSLGSHIAGIGSVTCSKGRVGRITALDPARPGFTDEKNDDRLHKSRADFVDVIHTSAHTYGIAEAIGHYDFYPNGGQAPQPGCTGVTSELCSHSRSHYLFTESITTDVGFRGIKCSTWTSYINGICTPEHSSSAIMGARINTSSEQGTYYLKTGATCPYYVVGTTSPAHISFSYSHTPILIITSAFLTQIFQR